MQRRSQPRKFHAHAALLAAAVLAIAAAVGCQSSAPAPPAARDSTSPALLNAAAPAAQVEPRPAAGDKMPIGRAQLWSQTCNRCHNVRSPDSYSSSEWSLIMTHMRIRGYLTGEDQRAILEFLQSQ